MHNSIENEDLEIDLASSVEALPSDFNFTQTLKECLDTCANFLMKSSELDLSTQGVAKCSVSVTLCDDEKMRELNNDYRGLDKTTDVLSFPIFEDLRSGEEFVFSQCELGDIIISWPVLTKQALEFNLTNEEEFIHLFIHGFLHLCGYDHELNEKEEELMQGLEKKLTLNILEKRKLRTK